MTRSAGARRRGSGGWRSARGRRAGGRSRRARSASTIPLHSSVLSLVMRPARTPPIWPASIWLRINDSSGETSSVGPAPCVAQQLRGDEVDRALAPPGSLHHERAPALLDERVDRVELVAAEVGVVAHELAEGGAGLITEIGHGRAACHAGETAVRRHVEARSRREVVEEAVEADALGVGLDPVRLVEEFFPAGADVPRRAPRARPRRPTTGRRPPSSPRST